MDANKTLTDYIWKDVVPTDVETLIDKSAEYLAALGMDFNTAIEAISKMCDKMQDITPNETIEITNEILLRRGLITGTLLKMDENINFIGAQTTDRESPLEIFEVKSPIYNFR